MEEELKKPIKHTLDTYPISVYYTCAECGKECQEKGECFEGEEPCYYCPPEICESCGRGYCDQSC